MPSFVDAAAGTSNVSLNSTQMELRKWCTRKTLRRKRTERSRSWIHGFKLVCLLFWHPYPIFVFMAGNMIYKGWIMTPIWTLHAWLFYSLTLPQILHCDVEKQKRQSCTTVNLRWFNWTRGSKTWWTSIREIQSASQTASSNWLLRPVWLGITAH